MSAKTVYKKGRFTVLKTSSSFIVRNDKLDYNHHSHFTNLKRAKRCIQLIDKRVLPQNYWWKEALRRLITEEEFENLRICKREAYYNVQGGKTFINKR